MLRKLSATTAALALVGGLLATAPAEAAATPSAITSVKATPGPGAGQVTFRWSTAGKNTAAFKLETGLTSFSKSRSSSLPTSGRNAKVFTISGKSRSWTMSAAQASAAGASVASANHLYFRLSAVNGSATRAYPRLQAVLPKAAAPKAAGSPLRMGSFNIRSAKVDGGPRWLSRATDVAREIRDQNPGIVAIQELSPGRADGKNKSTTGSVRQTTSLVNAMRSVGAPKYRLVRETPYVKPGVSHGSQGTRILYDTSRYTLISRCAEKTGNRNYSTSCSLDLPKLAGDGRNAIRSAAYARFQDRRTGAKLWVASVHLDARHSGSLAKERVYEDLRARQIKTVTARLAQVNTTGDRVVLAGDINSWQNNKGGYRAHDHLVGAGFFDGANAQSKVNLQYSTINHFDTRLSPGANGFGSRIDVIMVKGSRGSKRFVNVMRPVDSSRPSDHNMIVSDLVL
ncbi:endonuclease/exonuclease/phosphatase family protein [Microlunatus capsulatus]|uniref:Endonuclease/exonuclease/phosphatase family metal-dependent hydrolase n=1 Tax=Microlunatus capsulatus TaxID=99117 RepID=A0ABS4Z3I6_9ACTN|nr:endonuclease/exonuclease/phosphatase family protein [Microlunatus capsulatus]MBP2415295.1 endonuclease/exonuclease/phosphatase family metal-dependent hydrolase [Microlunatus capsulatus]